MISITNSLLKKFIEGYPYDVIVTRRENEGFGFVIISSVTKAGSTIGEFIGMCHPFVFSYLFYRSLEVVHVPEADSCENDH